MRRSLCWCLLFLGCAIAPARAQLWSTPHPHFEGTPPPGNPRCIPHTHERAGFPQWLAGHLQMTKTSGGIGYYVGGGAPVGHGDARCRHEGTWGWDETGSSHLRHRVILGWWHGRRYQGGQGAYRTDGPHVPDYIYGVNSIIDSARDHGGEAEGAH